MVAGLTIGRKKYVAVEAEMKEMGLRAAHLVRRLAELKDEDAAAYALVSNAYKLAKDTPEQVAARDGAIQAALMKAAEVPLETARWCAEVAQLAAFCAEKGNTNAASDAGVAALLAEASCRGAAYNVRINAVAMPNKEAGAPLVGGGAAAGDDGRGVCAAGDTRGRGSARLSLDSRPLTARGNRRHPALESARAVWSWCRRRVGQRR
jgi:glutamate formiminotransferase/formiminotetrahydrofolate cyclodeaminase